MTELCDLCVKHNTVKGPRSNNGWDYSPTYHKVLNSRRSYIKNVLEIGVWQGASLRVWRDYFPNANVYGIDCDLNAMITGEPRIQTVLANAYDGEQLDNALRAIGNNEYDFIVDDAVHDPGPQLDLLENMWFDLKPGGIYAMEDVCVFKIPGGLEALIEQFPSDSATEIVHTWKDEKLLLIYKSGY